MGRLLACFQKSKKLCMFVLLPNPPDPPNRALSYELKMRRNVDLTPLTLNPNPGPPRTGRAARTAPARAQRAWAGIAELPDVL